MELGKSNLEKFMICHEAEYVAGDDSCLKDFPFDPILPLEGTNNTVNIFAIRNYCGTYVNMPRAIQKTSVLEGVLYGQDKLDKLNSEIFDKISQYDSDHFYINTYFPGIGWYFTKVYLGTPVDMKALSITGTSVTRVKLEFIEIEGIVLNM